MENVGMGRLIGRRTFLKLGATAGMTAFMLGATGCSPSSLPTSGAGFEAASFTPGTYTAKARGKQSFVTTEVTFSEDAIESIEVVDHFETERIAGTAIEAITADIVELQSLDVDVVTGATLTSMALLAAVKDCVSQAGGDVSALEKVAGREKSDATEVIETEIAIIGAGAAGLTSAIALSEQGTDVVVMEKCGFMGGSLLVSGGRLQYPEAPLEYRQETTEPMRGLFAEVMSRARDLGVSENRVALVESQYEQWYAEGNTKTFDSDEYYAVLGAVGFGNPLAAETTVDAEAARRTCEWVTAHGVELEKPLLGIMGFSWPRSTHPVGKPAGAGYVDALDNYIQSAGFTALDILFSTSAQELLTEGDRIVGVKGLCDDGTTYEIHASKGVILATGGYADSPKWLSRLQPKYGFSEEESVHSVAPAGHSGDGLDMAEKVGASITSLGDVMLNPYAHPTYNIVGHVIGDTGNPLVVNKEGKRFMNETAKRTDLSMAVMEQTDEMCYIIASRQNSNIKEDGRNFDGEPAEKLFENELAYRADSLDELAGLVDLPTEVLKKTVEEYNAACIAGVADEFGRTYFEETALIAEGPYYATPCTWAVLITVDGLTVEASFKVLDEAGEPIPGLFAVGEVCGQPCLQILGYGEAIAKGVLG